MDNNTGFTAFGEYDGFKDSFTCCSGWYLLGVNATHKTLTAHNEAAEYIIALEKLSCFCD